MALRKGLPAKLALTDADDTRYVLSGLIVGTTAGVPRGGVLSPVGTNIVTATATMNVSVARFQAAAIRDAGVVLLSNDGATNVLLDAAPAANSRIDVIWAKQNDASSTVTVPDANNLPVLGFAKGAAGAVPVKPAIPAGAVELATVHVPSTATATNSSGVVITQTAQFTASAGGVVPFRTKGELELWTIASEGQEACALATGFTYRREAGVWKNTAAGLVLVSTLSFGGVTSAALDGIFTSEFDNYRVVARLSGFTTTELSARLRSGGADNSDATYDSTLHYGYTSTSSAVPYVGISMWQLIASITGGFAQFVLDITSPALASPTLMDSSHSAYNSGTGLTIKGGSGGGHRAASAFDGFSLVKPSGTFAGTVSVYGYNA